jgi:hypothetical protein
VEQIAGKVMGITAAKSLRWSRFQSRSIIETNIEAGVRERQPRNFLIGRWCQRVSRNPFYLMSAVSI